MSKSVETLMFKSEAGDMAVSYVDKYGGGIEKEVSAIDVFG